MAVTQLDRLVFVFPALFWSKVHARAQYPDVLMIFHDPHRDIWNALGRGRGVLRLDVYLEHFVYLYVEYLTAIKGHQRKIILTIFSISITSRTS